MGLLLKWSSARFRIGLRDDGVGEMTRGLRLPWLEVSAVDDSSKDGEGFNDNERSPERGLGVNVGVGKLWVMLARFSGVRDKGRRFRVAGRGLEGVGCVMATAGVVVMGDFIESIDEGGCKSCALLNPTGGSSSSSSSSSTRV